MNQHFAQLSVSTTHDAEKVLVVPAPTGVSPASTSEQKHDEKND